MKISLISPYVNWSQSLSKSLLDQFLTFKIWGTKVQSFPKWHKRLKRLLLSIFHLDKFFLKKYLHAYYWLKNFGNSPQYTVWKIKESGTVKNYYQKTQIVAQYCYWTLFLCKWKYISSWMTSVNTNVGHIYTYCCYSCLHQKFLRGGLCLSFSS